MSKKAIFLDRDGVINKEVNYLHKIDSFEFIDGVFDACLYFQHLDYKIIIISNQSGISRGYYTERDFQILTQWMLDKFRDKDIKILDVFYCPHDIVFRDSDSLTRIGRWGRRGNRRFGNVGGGRDV